MSTNSVRLNITIPVELSNELNQLASPRKRGRFVAEALEQKIKQLKADKLEKSLKEGYRATKKEGLALTEEFEATDIEGWDDY